MKKLYLISQDINVDFDTYDSAVVCAESVEEARGTSPDRSPADSWVTNPADVKVDYLGIADDLVAIGVVCTSSN